MSAAEIGFGPGLNVLTGETGAGKSILVDALSLLLGGRASLDLIRTGESQGSVEGIFADASLPSVLDGHGLPVDGDEAILRRDIGASGKGRASVNGGLVPLALLREIVLPRAEIHGQHDQKGLLDAESHVALIEEHAGLATAAAEVASAYRERARLNAELQALRQDRRELERRREMLEFQAREIEAAAPHPDEEQELRAQKAVQANAGRLRALSEEAYSLLYEDDHAGLTRLKQVFRRVEELAAIDPRFRPFAESRETLLPPLEDLALQLRDYSAAIETAPGRLDEIEARLALLERLKRKYGASVSEVIGFGARCREELSGLTDPERREAQLEGDLAAAALRFRAAALALSCARRTAAKDLEKRVEAELRQLALERARFAVAWEPEQARPDDPSTWSERGLERGQFLLSPNPGEELRPLARIASGGELSRILLALESAGSRGGPARTLVFDEVDAGIGGRVAEVVGRRLRKLASRHQVLCVTHLPQIAALAEVHFAVRKRVERGRTLTEVEELDEEARIEELARMLAGETVTETARRHAHEMVKQAIRS